MYQESLLCFTGAVAGGKRDGIFALVHGGIHVSDPVSKRHIYVIPVFLLGHGILKIVRFRRYLMERISPIRIYTILGIKIYIGILGYRIGIGKELFQ